MKDKGKDSYPVVSLTCSRRLTHSTSAGNEGRGRVIGRTITDTHSVVPARYTSEGTLSAAVANTGGFRIRVTYFHGPDMISLRLVIGLGSLEKGEMKCRRELVTTNSSA